MNLETSPLDHHARLIANLERARDNAIQQARVHAQEARTQRGIVLGILRELGLPEEDYNAERLVVEYVEALERKSVDLPHGWRAERTTSREGEHCWSAQRTVDAVEVWLFDDGEVDMDNVSAVVTVDELLAVLHHLGSLREQSKGARP